MNGGPTVLYGGINQFGPGHKLLPAPLGFGRAPARRALVPGQCPHQWFIYQSMQANIAIYKANCAQADAVGLGAYQAMGAPFHADGLPAWPLPKVPAPSGRRVGTGTNYAYNCSSASSQVAFNWGPHYDTCGASATGGRKPECQCHRWRWRRRGLGWRREPLARR